MNKADEIKQAVLDIAEVLRKHFPNDISRAMTAAASTRKASVDAAVDDGHKDLAVDILTTMIKKQIALNKSNRESETTTLH